MQPRSKTHFLPAMAIAIALTLASLTPAAAQVPNPDWDAVREKLDEGGSLYIYADLEDLFMNLITQVESAVPAQSPIPGSAIGAMARSVVQGLGLDQLDDIGISVVPLSENTGRMKAYLHLNERAGIFSLMGGEPRELEGLALIPADAVAADIENLQMDAIIPLVRQVATNVMGAAGQAYIDSALQQIHMQTGANLEAMLASIDNEAGAYVRLDAQRQVILAPGSNENLTMSRPSFAVLFKVKDNTMRDAIFAMLARAQEGMLQDEAGPDGLEMKVLRLDNPFDFEPAFAQSGSWFIIASDPAEMANALQTRASGQDIRTAPEFMALAEDLPREVNSISFISPRAGQEFAAMLQRIAGLQGVDAFPNLFASQAQRLAMSPGQVSIQINEPSGIQWITVGDVKTSDIVMSAAAAPMAIMAAIAVPNFAVPNFLEAQTRAKVARAKADQRSIATALEAYNIDFNAYPPSSDQPGSMLGGQGVSSFAGHQLTTPIAYMTMMPTDPDAEGQPLGYYAPDDGKSGWILFGRGPDGDFDLDWEKYNPADPNWSQDSLAPYTYDPTNGTVSDGDVYRLHW